MKKFAVVYRNKESGKLTRESGLSFEQAEKLADKMHGNIHIMNGVKSYRVK